MCTIKIIDSIMGSGKTSYAIQQMNQDNENNYIYITPFLTEVQRIKDNTTRKFYEPVNIGNGKLDSLHKLLADNKNIASTHALFRMSNEITRELIKANNYILILDEVCDVIEQIPLKKNDLHTILEYSHIDNDFLIWDDLEYDGRYNDIKIMALNKTLMIVNNTLLMWNFPVNIFEAFKECYIMTFIFSCQIQRYYYDLHNVNYTYYSIIKENDLYKLIPYSQQTINKTNLRNNIHIIENDAINNIGDDDYTLSATWYNKDKNKLLIQKLKKNIYNYFQNKMRAKANQILWTTFKDSKSKLTGKGYTRAFLSCNARATNEYKDRYILAYCINVFLNPIVKNFFENRNITVEENNYALSELLQWLWRSAIREGKQIYIYIPSSRMRNLLIEWLNN